MKEALSARDTSIDSLLSQLADEFAKRLRGGEKPTIEEYTERHPEIANILQQVLTSVEVMCSLGADAAFTSGLQGPHTRCEGQLGDFRIKREIGRGGMGVVYEAEQISLSRRVALKVLPFAAMLDPRHLQRFRNEAQAAASLDHANIVSIHSVGCERGVHYYAMQYIEGHTLAQVIEELREHAGPASQEDHEGTSLMSQLTRDLCAGRVVPAAQHSRGGEPTTDYPAEELGPASAETAPDHKLQAKVSTNDSIRRGEFFRSVAHLGIQAAEALEYAHQLGVVHRDIKPSNLMVDARGHLWITDFGLAITQAESNITMTGDIVGTLRYMSAEQVQGRRHLLDHRTDIYSLGVTLYELLTLKPAFGDDAREKLIRQISDAEPPRPRQINRAIPRDLETIVLKAIAKEPTARYATSQELADDLRRFLADEPIHARRPVA